MPEKLDRCVKKVMGQGYDKSRAYAICSKSTGWKRGKGGKWVKRKEKSESVLNELSVRDVRDKITEYLEYVRIGLEDVIEVVGRARELASKIDVGEREVRGRVKTGIVDLERRLRDCIGDEYSKGTVEYLLMLLNKVRE